MTNQPESQVLVTDYFPDPALEASIFETHGFKVVHEKSVAIDFECVVGLLVWHRIVDADYLAKFPNVKAVVRYGVGVDNLDRVYMSKNDMKVANTTDYGVDEVADHSIALALYGLRGLGHSRAVVQELSDDSWQHNVPPGVRRFSGLTFGVLGLGRIGASVALKAKALGFRVQFYDPYVSQGTEKSLAISRASSLSDFAASSDIVSVHVNLNTETAGIISSQFLGLMKDDSILVNTSRGKVIDDFLTIMKNLEYGKLLFVGLDVLPVEPFNRFSPDFDRAMALIQSGKLLVTPHVGFYSYESITEMRRTASNTLLDLLSGKDSPYEL